MVSKMRNLFVRIPTLVFMSVLVFNQWLKLMHMLTKLKESFFNSRINFQDSIVNFGAHVIA